MRVKFQAETKKRDIFLERQKTLKVSQKCAESFIGVFENALINVCVCAQEKAC